MTNDLLKRLRSTAKAGSLLPPYPEVISAAADRIEGLEKALQIIAEYHPEITHTWAENVRYIAWIALRDGKQ
jgi:hypothetical protein